MADKIDTAAQRREALLKQVDGLSFIGMRYPEANDPNKTAQDRWTMLSQAERQFIAANYQTYGKAVKNLTLMPANPNERNTFQDAFALSLHPDAPMSASLVPEHPFGYTTLTPIADDHQLSDGAFAARAEKFSRAVSAALKSGGGAHPSIGKHFDAKQPHADRAPWKSPLVGPHELVGVYSSVDDDDDDDGKQYVIVASASAGPTIGRELQKLVTENPKMTVGDYAAHPAVAWARQLGQRNAERITHIAAAALGVEPDQPSTPDIAARTPDYHDYVMRATPSVATSYNTFAQRPYAQPVGDVVTFYHNCADGAASVGSLLMLGDVSAPLYEYQGSENIEHAPQIHNQLFNALPAFTPKLTDKERTSKLSRMPSSVRERISSNFTADVSHADVYGHRMAHSTTRAVVAPEKLGLVDKPRRFDPVLVYSAASSSSSSSGHAV